MDVRKVKETMDQIHISDEMQEEIIINIQRQMQKKAEKRQAGGLKKMAAAAGLVLAVSVFGLSVQAVVKSVTKVRMESIPPKEIQEVLDLLRRQNSEAETYSREYSDEENKRRAELWRAYEDGTFPEKEIVQVDHAADVKEDELSYIKDSDTFYLPERELTDEELLEIIDFQHIKIYAIEQSPEAQEARAEQQEEQEKLKKRVEAFGGLSEEKALAMAVEQMKAELGDDAEGTELQWITLEDIEESDDGTSGNVVYSAIFRNRDAAFWYECVIDTAGGGFYRRKSGNICVCRSRCADYGKVIIL